MIINGYFMLLFDLTPDQSASGRHKPLSENGNFKIELKFDKPLGDPVNCPLYLEYDGTFG
jgi:hypothetical protein